MARPLVVAILAAVALVGCTSKVPDVKPDRSLQRQGAPNTMHENRRIRVNGIDIYYEVHGRADGIPLVLLPGGGSTIETTFSRILPALAASRRVIALEEQGHGRTSDRDQPITFEASADDVAGLVRHLGLEQIDILGFSNGASVGLQVAIRHPGLVRKLVFASAMTRRDGAPAELWNFMARADISNMPQPLKDAFLRVTPDQHRLKVMHDKDAQRMREFKDVGDDLVRSVRAAVLIVVGDRDVVRLEHDAGPESPDPQCTPARPPRRTW